MIEILAPTLVPAAVGKAFPGAACVCSHARNMASIHPPVGSPTAQMIFGALMQGAETIQIAFVDEVTEDSVPPVESCYRSDLKLVIIRTDQSPRLREYGAGGVAMPPVILLYHELGHAKQDLDGNFERLTEASAQDRLPIQVGRPEANTNVAFKKSWGGKPQLRSGLDLYGFNTNVEHNNMRLHEYPMCRELGVPIRTNYRDLS